jgi:hypothetical protein
VTIRYENEKPFEATQIVVSTQHYDETLSSHDIQAIVEPYVRKAQPAGWITQTAWHVNPTGKFVIGGPDGDCGLTGRPMAVALFLAKTPHRSTAPPPTPRVADPSTPAPAPMAISAAHRRRMAASPGNAPTSLIRRSASSPRW